MIFRFQPLFFRVKSFFVPLGGKGTLSDIHLEIHIYTLCHSPLPVMASPGILYHTVWDAGCMGSSCATSSARTVRDTDFSRHVRST